MNNREQLKPKSSLKPSGEQGIYFEDMKSFLRYLTPTRLRLLNLLRLCGPSSIEVLSQSLKRNQQDVLNDVKALRSDKLLRSLRSGALFVTWDKIDVNVKQSISSSCMSDTKNIIDLPTAYLTQSARRFSWLHVNINKKIINLNTHKYICTFELVEKI